MKNKSDKKNASLVFGFDDIINGQPIIEDVDEKQITNDSIFKNKAVKYGDDENESKIGDKVNSQNNSISDLLSDSIIIKEDYSKKWNLVLKKGVKGIIKK
ncbi:hypothetical protein [Seonamhaeicola sp.]|uniref:hypothetical protein n=1 Tax=Seonamhaeicola sp. TaxID=1912245 RepID=UPI00262AC947|nr:hypothetical protein [Seonamhaeicola sp.]